MSSEPQLATSRNSAPLDPLVAKEKRLKDPLIDLSPDETQHLAQPSPYTHQGSDRPSSPSTPVSRVVTATDDSIIFTNPSSVESQNTTSSNANGGEQQREVGSIQAPPTAEPLTMDTVVMDSNETYDEQEQEQDYDNSNEHTGLLSPLKATNKVDDLEPSVSPHTKQDKPLPDAPESSDCNASIHSNGSYIQDPNHEGSLLNNYTRKRRSTTRTDSVATVPQQPTQRNHASSVNVLNKRDSVITQDSKVLDTASMEIARMRTSVLVKREKKKQRNMTDDEKVLVGNKVSEGHVNYVVAYNMLTGIRVAVSRCSGIMQPLTDQDFKMSKKLVFDVSGNELTPSSKYDFKFKDYCPTVFRELRVLFGLDPADYLVSLTSKYILSELNSPGKSGSFFYFSRDYRFIIKTIHRSEHRQLRRILKDYHAHVKAYPNTMISQFYGLHRVKMSIIYGKRRKIYFIVMNNLFPPHRDIHRTYDLKGSTLGRYTNINGNSHAVMKDLNWLQEREIVKFGPTKERIFLEQLKKDVDLLIRMNIMDYSFLIGIHDLSKDTDDEILKRKKLSVFSPVSNNLVDLKNTNPKLLNHLNDLPSIEYNKGNVFYAEEGGITSTGENDEPENYVYYLGIIDCLTKYSIIKRLETFWRTLRHDRAVVSSIPPKEYGERLLRFIQHSVNENTAGEAPTAAIPAPKKEKTKKKKSSNKAKED